MNLEPEVVRTDSIQSFQRQETPIVKITDSDGVEGVGYTYTIGTGGSSVYALLRDHLLPQVVGRDSQGFEAIWNDLKFSTNATMIGPITTLALAAIDTAVWDLNAKRANLSLCKAAGGARAKAPLYTTECGWLHLSAEELVEGVVAAKEEGFAGAKIKVGKPSLRDDVSRLEAVRKAVGDDFEVMVDCNQAFKVGEAIRRAHAFSHLNLAWIEEPLPAEDLSGHKRLAQATSIPIAVGESIYSIQHFREYMQQDACSIIQVDVARIGGITPWLKTAHAAETFNMDVAPHFLMEIHAPLVCAVQNGRWVEHIPQLRELCTQELSVKDGCITPSADAGNGITWDWSEIERRNLL